MRLLVHVVPGLEDIAGEEIEERFPRAELAGAWRRFDERTSLLEYRSSDNPCAWRRLDTAEDVFVLAARAQAVQPDRRGLAELAAATLRSRHFEGALRAFEDCWGGRPRSFRVVARKAGFHAYRRVDAQRAIESAVGTLLPTARLVDDDADAEFWLTLIGTTALIGLRLSGAEMRGHDAPFISLPASLKPTVARAMARLTDPTAGDRVLDPLCGAGTLLLERAAIGPYSRLLGGDLDLEAVEVAIANTAAAGRTADIEQWDALALPLADRSVDVVLTNPPFGKRVEIRGDAAAFYRRLLRELRRVLTEQGRLVLLTSQTAVMQRALHGLSPPLPIRRRLPILVRGEAAIIYVAGGSSQPNGASPERSP
jgi:tRNA (guanine6-N2)-methyltransferase